MREAPKSFFVEPNNRVYRKPGRRYAVFSPARVRCTQCATFDFSVGEIHAMCRRVRMIFHQFSDLTFEIDARDRERRITVTRNPDVKSQFLSQLFSLRFLVFLCNCNGTQYFRISENILLSHCKNNVVNISVKRLALQLSFSKTQLRIKLRAKLINFAKEFWLSFSAPIYFSQCTKTDR